MIADLIATALAATGLGVAIAALEKARHNEKALRRHAIKVQHLLHRIDRDNDLCEKGRDGVHYLMTDETDTDRLYLLPPELAYVRPSTKTADGVYVVSLEDGRTVGRYTFKGATVIDAPNRPEKP